MENYKVIRSIGKGSFGKVYLVKHTGERKQYVMKVVKLAGIPRAEREACFKEVDMMKTMEHPAIVAFKQAFFSEGKRHLCIVMTHCDGGDLEQRLKRAKGKLLREDLVMHWFVQMALGLQYMHAHRVLHRDIKSQNIFMLGTGRLVLGDLGIAKALGHTAELAKTTIGTPYYMSPELFKNKPYNHKSDVWALGCVLYEMATFKHPFEASSLHSLAGKIMRGSYTSINAGYSKPLHGLISSMLALRPEARPDLATVLATPYVKRHVYNFMKDVAARAGGPGARIGDGTMLLGNVVAQVAAGGGAAAALGPHAAALYRQLDELQLSEVVTKAFESVNPEGAPPAPSVAAPPAPPAGPAPAAGAAGGGASGAALEAQRALREQRNALSREQERRQAVQVALAKLREEKDLRAAERQALRERARAATGSGRRARPAYLQGAAARRGAALHARSAAAAAADERRAAVAARRAAIERQRQDAARAWEAGRASRPHAAHMAAQGVGLDAVRAASAAARAPAVTRGASAPRAPGGKEAEPTRPAAPTRSRSDGTRGVDRTRQAAADDARRLALLGLGAAGPGPRVRDPFQRAAAAAGSSAPQSAKDRVLAAKAAKAEAAQAAHMADLAVARASGVAEKVRAAEAARAQYVGTAAAAAAGLPVSAAGGGLYAPPTAVEEEAPLAAQYGEVGGEGELPDSAGGEEEEEEDVAVQMELAASARAPLGEPGSKEEEAEEEELEAEEEEVDLAEAEVALQAELAASTLRVAALKASLRGHSDAAALPPVLEADVAGEGDVLAEYEGEGGDPALDGEEGDFYAVSAAVGVDVLFQAPGVSPSELPGHSAFQAPAPALDAYAHPPPGGIPAGGGTAHLVSQCAALREACGRELGAAGFAAVYREVQALFLSEDGDDGQSPLEGLVARWGAASVGHVQQLVQMEEAIAM